MGFTMKVTLQNKSLLYIEFGRRLARVRKQKHLSQAALGNLVGLSRTSITNIERGRQAVQLHQVYSLASVLGVDVYELCPKQIAIPLAPVQNISPQQKYLERAKQLVPTTKPQKSNAS